MNIIVILGKILNDDGSMLDELKVRLDLGIETYNNHKDVEMIVVSGGIANRKAKISEAQVMYDYLTKKGISKDIIRKEEHSKSTRQNAIFTKWMLKKSNVDKIYLVSNKYHFFRTHEPTCIALFEKYFKKSEIISIYEK